MPRPRKVPGEKKTEKTDEDARTLAVASVVPPSAGDDQEDDDAEEIEEDDDQDDGEDDEDDDDDDEEDDDGDREDDTFDKMMAKLTGAAVQPAKGGAAPGSDLGSMLVVMMMQERAQSRREAREMRREQAKAKASMDRLMLSILLKGNKPDPFMLEMFKTMAGGEQQKATFKAMMDINSENAKAQLANMKELFSSTDELKNRVFEQVLSRMEGNGKDSSSGSVALDVIRELKDVAAPIITSMASKNQPRTQTRNQAQVAPGTGSVPALPNPGAGSEAQAPDPVSIIMRTVHHVHAHPNMTPAERRRIRSQLATVIMDVPALAEAIVQDDEKGAAECVQAYVLSDPTILAWVQQPGVADWLNAYLKNEIADVLDAMMEVEEGPSGDQNDEGDEDEPEGERRTVVAKATAGVNGNGNHS